MGCGASKPKGTPDPRLSSAPKLSMREEGRASELCIEAQNFVIQSSKVLLNNYKIIKTVGKGAFGEIFATHHRSTNSKRAIKVVQKPQLLQDDEGTMDVDELMNEIDMMKRLDHPNVLKMYEFFQDDKRFYLAMELCEGGTVADVISEDMGEHDAAIIMRQVMSAINYCHRKKVIHRDIKPEQILLQYDNSFKNLKVTDFGLATTIHEGQELTTMCGTPSYTAPEILTGNYSFPADIWSCGIMAFMLVVGYVPFFLVGKEIQEIVNIITEGVDIHLANVEKEISAEAKDFISKLTQVDPAKRMTAAEALEHPWLDKAHKQISLGARRQSTMNALDTLSHANNFNRGVLAKATYAYIASQLVSQKDKDNLMRIFQALDTKGLGCLEKETFIKGYFDHFGHVHTPAYLEDLFNNLDVSNSGTIEYSEFLAAFASVTHKNSEETMQQVFNAFDQDGTGVITRKEVKQVLSFGSDKRVNDKVLDAVMKQVSSGDRESFTFEQFTKMLQVQVGDKPVAAPAAAS